MVSICYMVIRVNFICFYIIFSFHIVIFYKFKRMCSYHLKDIIARLISSVSATIYMLSLIRRVNWATQDLTWYFAS